MDLKARKRQGNEERPRCCMGKAKVKLWEEPDQQLEIDDVRGGSCSFWAERQLRRRAHPSPLQSTHTATSPLIKP